MSELAVNMVRILTLGKPFFAGVFGCVLAFSAFFSTAIYSEKRPGRKNLRKEKNGSVILRKGFVRVG